MAGVSEAYHIPFGFQLGGKLDREALRQALDRILARHEALRTTFAFVDREPEPRIAGEEGRRFQLLEHDSRQQNDATAGLTQLLAQESFAAFDLDSGSLVRGRRIRPEE